MKKFYFVCFIGFMLSVLVHAQNENNFIINSTAESNIRFFTGLGYDLTVIVPGRLNGKNITTIDGSAFASKRPDMEII